MNIPPLTWFPKPFGAGDNAGGEADKPLGKPNLDPASIFVREMAQNSWDARLAGHVPEFEIHLRSLEGDPLEFLRRNLFEMTGPEELGLGKALDTARLTVVEVTDRGTKGLGGPTRNDRVVECGDPTDYKDFVLTLGAPPDQEGGGGTYGYGKTAAYAASACSTIVIWSRARRGDGHMDERFIASAMGPGFALGQDLYTGRQWWGRPPHDQELAPGFRVEPVEGWAARMLGEAIFARSFEADETGTSMLILQPKLDGAPVQEGTGEEELIGLWRDAMVRNLWPKLPPEAPADRRMELSLKWHGEEVPLRTDSGVATLAAAQRCLQAVRDQESQGLVTCIPVRRYSTVIGTVALTRFPSDERPGPVRANSIVFMRDSAELVVWEEPIEDPSGVAADWIGVFKPAAEYDPIFAGAEPPAHESWHYKSLEDRVHKSIVKMAVEGAIVETRKHLNPIQDGASVSNTASTGVLASSLAGLTGAVIGSAATGSPGGGKPVSGRSSGKTIGPRVEVQTIQLMPQSEHDLVAGRQTTRVKLTVSGTGQSVRIAPSRLSLAVDGGSLDSEGLVSVDSWLRDGEVADGESVSIEPGKEVFAEISYPMGLAIDFDFAVVSDD